MSARIVAGHVVREIDLPDPPENPDFLELPEAFQEKVADRFERGARRTVALAEQAHQAWIDQVSAMLDRRRAYNDRERARKEKAREKYMANRATVGQLAERHVKR